VLAASVAVLDLCGHALHAVYHYVPVLWRFHRVHHTDLDCDCTTGLRFHPLEAVATGSIQLGVVALLGLSPAGVFIYKALLAVAVVIEHANVRLPSAADRVLRLFVVTPDMHRVHHSVVEPETNSNFGAVLPWWDRLFWTYRDQPTAGHEGMTIGLPEFRGSQHVTLHWMLALPFLPDALPVAIEQVQQGN
jgi:sterol desaturase/sphingolipid hydroxylase (fatty acid hydroxylase superfamily)